MKRKDNYVMVKRAKPKRINLPNGRLFVARYERIRRERLLPNVAIKRSYEQRPAPSNKQRWQGEKGLFSFTKKVAKNPAVNACEKAALKKAPVLLYNKSKRAKNKTLKSILDSDATKAIFRRGSKNLYGRMGGTN